MHRDTYSFHQSATQRLTAAREQLQLTEAATASAIGLSVAEYRDLEHDAGELFSNLSLARLQLLADAVRLTTALLLTGTTRDRSSHVSFGALTEALRKKLRSRGESVEQFSTRVGWELADVLVDPSEFWNFTVDGLCDVCVEVGIDWIGALPEPVPISAPAV